MCTRFFGIFFILHLIVLQHINAQPKCKITTYSIGDGLSHDNVTCIFQDRDGFMWIGTWDGINRFDGQKFITYKSRAIDKSVSRSNRVDRIAEDAHGQLWIRGYDGQIYRFDKKNDTFYAASQKINKSAANYNFQNIFPMRTGDIWLPSEKNGVFCSINPDAENPVFTEFSENRPKPFHLPSNKINFIYEDSVHHVWLSTASGLVEVSKTNGNRLTSRILTRGQKQIFARSAAETSQAIYFGTVEGNLLIYEKLSKRVSEINLCGASINKIKLSKDGRSIYTATADGQIITLNKNGILLSSVTIQTHESLNNIFEDSSGILWIEPAKQGAIRYNPLNHSFKFFSQPFDLNYYGKRGLFEMVEDRAGTVWIAMKGGGLGYYNSKHDEIEYYYDTNDPLQHRFSNIISTIYYDKDGVIWLTSSENGLVKIVSEPYDFHHNLFMPNSLIGSDNETRGLCVDNKGRTWLATKGGKVFVVDAMGHRLEHLLDQDKVKVIGQVYCIFQSTDRRIWLGTKSNGLYLATPKDTSQTSYSVTNYLHDPINNNSLSGNVVYAIFEDKMKQVWIGTYDNGLNLVKDENHKIAFLNNGNFFKNYPKDFIKIRAISQDVRSRLWIGTTRGLIIIEQPDGNHRILNLKTFSKQNQNGRLVNNDIQFIRKDRKGYMWLATSGAGIDVANGQLASDALTFHNYSTMNGIPSDYILSIIEDHDGNIWAATEKGLSKMERGSGKFINYDTQDGLPAKHFAESSCALKQNGNLVFGLQSGYIDFNPKTIVTNKITGRMVLTDLLVNNQKLAAGRDDSGLSINPNYLNELVLNHNQNTLSIYFGVLDYRFSKRQDNEYRLKNFDQGWKSSRDQNVATYTNIPPGSYQFEVRCTEQNLYENTPYKSIKIIIQPPFWKTWWAYACYTFIILILFELARRTAMTMLRLRQRIAIEKKLTELKLAFFTNISHELRTPLTLILNPIEKIAEDENLSEQGRKFMEVVKKNANRMVRSINQLLDLRKVQSGKSILHVQQIEVKGFVSSVLSYFQESAKEKGLTLELITSESELIAWLDVEKMDIVIYNLVANAIKFSPRDSKIIIDIRIDSTGQWLDIRVIDQGDGVPEKKLEDIFELYYEGDHPSTNTIKGTGIGLALSKEFVELHQGKIHALNNIGGFTILVRLRRGNAHFNALEMKSGKDIINVDFARPEQINKDMLRVPSTVPLADAPRLLLVEDNHELRQFMQIQLSELYIVDVAENGFEGLRKAEEFKPDLIISDVMMPELNGIQMLDLLKKNEDTSHIPVVLLSARSAIEHQIESLKYGADLYITKPFENAYLLAAIENLLAKRKRSFEKLAEQKQTTIKLDPGEIVITTKDEEFLKTIIHIVEEKMDDPAFNIEQIADEVSMARTTFYTKFKSLTNLAPVEFIREMRLKRAKQYLDAGESDISRIAYAVGFSNAKYFSTCFKEKYVITPTEYVKEIKFGK